MSMAAEPSLGPPFVLNLKTVVRRIQAVVFGESPVNVITMRDQWSYAAGFQLDLAGIAQAERISVHVELTVLEGTVGLIFTKDDLREILGNDEERCVNDGDTRVDILVDDAPDRGWLVVRNNAPGDVPSQCVIRSITLSRLSASPLRGFSEWAPRDETGRRLFAALRQKWNEVPVGLGGRRKTADLLKLKDTQLERMWLDTHREATQGPGYAARGWYQDLYADALRGKKVLDVGSGLGIDGITFAKAGATITYLDIAESNLALLKRLCGIFGIHTASFFYLEDLDSLDQLPDDFDVIWCQGSMLHVPFEFSRREAQRLLRHLRVGGRWIELAYPRERWERDGSPPFDQWGKYTDGAATPWAQWYDLPGLIARLEPTEFDVVLSLNFHNNDFNWFDLRRKV